MHPLLLDLSLTNGYQEIYRSVDKDSNLLWDQ